MDNSFSSPEPPSLAGLVWRPVTRDDLAALVALAVECQLADGGLAFLNEPEALLERCFPDAPGAMIGAFDADGRLRQRAPRPQRGHGARDDRRPGAD